jgi:hypothetical protein
MFVLCMHACERHKHTVERQTQNHTCQKRTHAKKHHGNTNTKKHCQQKNARIHSLERQNTRKIPHAEKMSTKTHLNHTEFVVRIADSRRIR